MLLVLVPHKFSNETTTLSAAVNMRLEWFVLHARRGF
jgi:hypothetical protein